jgi:hypothetical protein
LTLDQFLQVPEQELALEFDSDWTIHEKISTNNELLERRLALLMFAVAGQLPWMLVLRRS